MLNASTTHHDSQTGVWNASILVGCVQVRFSQMEYLPWDNPENIVNTAVETFSKGLKDAMAGVLFLIGGPANVINMAVFYTQGLKDRVNLCLFSLSFSDCLYLTASLFLGVEAFIFPTDKFLTNNNFVFFMGLCYVSLVLSAIIACERCYCVFRPLIYQSLLRTKTMGYIIVTVYLVVLTLFFVVAFKFRVGSVYDPDTGTVLQPMVAGTFYKNHKNFINFLDSVVFGAGFPGGTMIVVLIATVLTAIKLRQIMAWRAGTSSSLSAREVALTKMLIGSSVFFIVCISPTCVFRVVRLFLPEMRVGGRHHNFYNTTLWILAVFTNVNSTFNFVIYYVMGSRYREVFWKLFSRNRNGNKTRDVKEKNLQHLNPLC